MSQQSLFGISPLPWIVAGFAINWVLAFVPSCGVGGGGGTCSAEDCYRGCCDASGKCVAGNFSNACGVKGNACVACPSNQTCFGGICTLLTGTSDSACTTDSQ